MLQTTKENFYRLENRLLSINSNLDNINAMREMIYGLVVSDKPTLIMATGGSKVVAYYLQLLLERLWPTGIICEVIEPRDYFYKHDREEFSNLVAISASGNTNGVKDALDDFRGQKYLVCEKKQVGNYEVVSWGNETYDTEHSFISIASSLGPISMLLDTTTVFGGYRMEIGYNEIKKANERIAELLRRSQEKILNLPHSFKEDSIIHIMSGYDTKCSSSALESNLVESGLCAPIIHDKGSFCHGRSNLISDSTPIIYLSHDQDDLDTFLLDTISQEYETVYQLNSSDLYGENYFWREYYLLLQMYYLSKKIAEDKDKDLTKPDYNPRLIKSLYNYRGNL